MVLHCVVADLAAHRRPDDIVGWHLPERAGIRQGAESLVVQPLRRALGHPLRQDAVRGRQVRRRLIGPDGAW